MQDREFIDYYEFLQLSPNADSDTIQRVFRLLAQRHHPDNPTTGDVETFRRLSEAYSTLSDPERRAAYDVAYEQKVRLRWKIFEQSAAAQGFQGERRKRQGILAMLYAKRLNDVHSPTVSLMEMEAILGCPREHLEFSLWYLRETQQIARSDNARYTITAKGVETMENAEESVSTSRRLLDSARQVVPGDEHGRDTVSPMQ